MTFEKVFIKLKGRAKRKQGFHCSCLIIKILHKFKNLSNQSERKLGTLGKYELIGTYATIVLIKKIKFT